MGGFFGITSRKDCLLDVFFGTDYHSHLGTARGGLAAYDPEIGLQRKIHSITNAPFRTKFEHIFDEMQGIAAIGCISDTDPQPMLIRSNHGTYAICTIGIINNAQALIDQYLSFSGGHFDAMTGGRVNTVELVAALIDQKTSFGEGIKFAQSVIDGTCSILILKEDGHLVAARDKVGRIPVITSTKQLTEDDLVSILTTPRNALIKQYRRMFQIEGVELEFTDEALREIAHLAVERETGARGLRSICEEVLQDVMFDLPSDLTIQKVIVTKESVEGTEKPIVMRNDDVASGTTRKK
jgi:glutamine phosphoribosylpyrophosphate amidotransferase